MSHFLVGVDRAEHLLAGAAVDDDHVDAADGFRAATNGGRVAVRALHRLSPLSPDISGLILAEACRPGDPHALPGYLFHTGATRATIQVAGVKVGEQESHADMRKANSTMTSSQRLS